jgi:hypothetical protein
MLKMIGSDPILAIKRFSPCIPVVLISGYALLPPQELSHVDAHVGKGATLDILLDKIRALVVAHESSPAPASGSLEKRNETKLSAWRLGPTLCCPPRPHVAACFYKAETWS